MIPHTQLGSSFQKCPLKLFIMTSGPRLLDALWSSELLHLSAHYGVTQYPLIMWACETEGEGAKERKKTEKILIEKQLKKNRKEQTQKTMVFKHWGITEAFSCNFDIKRNGPAIKGSFNAV